MKARIFNGQTKSDVGKTRQMPSGERRCTPAMADSDRMPRLRHIAQEMGGPLSVVIGRMEYLLERGADKETTRSLNAIMPQAQRLVELRQQLIDEVSAALTGTALGSPASTREAEQPDT